MSSKYSWRRGGDLAKGNTARDIVQRVCEKAVAGASSQTENYSTWDPEKGELLPWLKRQVWRELIRLSESATHQRERRFAPENDSDNSEAVESGSESQECSKEASPLEIAIKLETQREAKRKVADLLEAIDHDPELVELVETILEGNGPPRRELAENLNISPDQVTNRMKRLLRHAKKVVTP